MPLTRACAVTCAPALITTVFLTGSRISPDVVMILSGNSTNSPFRSRHLHSALPVSAANDAVTRTRLSQTRLTGCAQNRTTVVGVPKRARCSVTHGDTVTTSLCTTEVTWSENMLGVFQAGHASSILITRSTANRLRIHRPPELTYQPNEADSMKPDAPSATATISQGSINTGAEPIIWELGDTAAAALNSRSNVSRAPGVSKT